VALTIALHEAAAERLNEIQKFDAAIKEIQSLILKIQVGSSTDIRPRDFPTGFVYLYKPDKIPVLKGLDEELMRIKISRQELYRTHQTLYVQGLMAQMQHLGGISGNGGSGGGRH